MAKGIRTLIAALALSSSLPGFSQSSADIVQQLAPQLVPFAGSTGNFQNLVNGLALGLPVFLTTLTPDGFTQTVTFTPVLALVPLDIARTLELARQALIARGIATPTAQQLGVTLAGGTLPTAGGAVPVAGLIPVAVPANATASAAGSSAAAVPPASSGGLAIQINPTPGLLPSAGAAVAGVPLPRFTSDSPFLRNTSNTPVLAVPAPFNTSASPAFSTSASPSFNTSNSPVLAPFAGMPSPAIQLQIRR
jgi:hypothetical protein